MEVSFLKRHMQKNALMLVILSYLFMPYPAKPGIPAFCSFVLFAICCCVFLCREKIVLDTYIGLGILLFFCYDFFFVGASGFNFSFFRAYSFGLLTFAGVVVLSNLVSFDRLMKGLYIWFLLTFLISLSQNVAGEFFFIPLWFKYFGEISECSLFNFCIITTPVGFNIAKTQLAFQLSFFIPMMMTLCVNDIFKKSQRLIILVVMAILLVIVFSRSAWVAIFVSILILLLIRFSKYYKVALIFSSFALLTFLIISIEDRTFKCSEDCSDGGGVSRQILNTKLYRLADPKNNISPPNNISPKSVTIYSAKDIVSQHSLSGADHSSKMRLKLAQIGIELAKEFPFGGGSGFFHNNYYEKSLLLYPAEAVSQKKSRIGPHNTYILILAEKGIAGLLVFVFVLGRVGFLLWRKYQTEENYFVLAVLTGFIGMLAYSFSHDTLTDRVFWIGLGLAVAFSCEHLHCPEQDDTMCA